MNENGRVEEEVPSRSDDESKIIAKTKTVRYRVPGCVAERRKWKKFGSVKELKSNTSISFRGEGVSCEFLYDNSVVVDSNKPSSGKVDGAGQCRVCEGAHWTYKCPYNSSASDKMQTSDQYEGDRRGSDRPFQRNEDGNVVRITNLPEDTTDFDLKYLVGEFKDSIERVFLSSDRETRKCRGFAFVTFKDKDVAQKAISKLNGYIQGCFRLNAGWSTK